MTKKIVHLITGLGQGGAENMLYKIISHTDKTKCDMIVISIRSEDVFSEKIRQLGIPVYHLNAKKITIISALYQYIKIIKKFKPDIVQAWMYHANMFAMLARPFLAKHDIYFNIRACLDCVTENEKLTKCVIKMNAWLSRFVDIVINNSTLSQTQHRRFGFRNKRDIYIGNGFDLSQFRPSADLYYQFRQQHQLSPTTKIIAIFARYHPIKNHIAFLEMARRLSQQQTNIIFLMAGSNVDHNNQLLSKHINEFNLDTKMILVGNVDVAKYMPVCDVIVSPSLSEGFSNVLGEAMACGVPCVAYDVGESANILNEYGYIVPLNDIDGLIRSTQNILQLDTESYHFLSEHCRKHIQHHFSLSSIAKQYETIYLGLKPCVE